MNTLSVSDEELQLLHQLLLMSNDDPRAYHVDDTCFGAGWINASGISEDDDWSQLRNTWTTLTCKVGVELTTPPLMRKRSDEVVAPRL
jgi:hypothetical protein